MRIQLYAISIHDTRQSLVFAPGQSKVQIQVHVHMSHCRALFRTSYIFCQMSGLYTGPDNLSIQKNESLSSQIYSRTEDETRKGEAFQLSN
jgi:hypothetical protein